MLKCAGQVINGFEIIESRMVKTSNSKNTVYVVKCLKCGAVSDKRSGDVKNGKARCNCQAKRHNHGLSRTPLYNVYTMAKRRTCNPNAPDYMHYGGRGIKMCDEWKQNYLSFHEWAISNGYKEGLTLDRIDVNGDYSPDNCRFVTMETQGYNKRNTHHLTFEGKTQSMAEWAKERNIPYKTLFSRIAAGWTVQEALTAKREKQ